MQTVAPRRLGGADRVDGQQPQEVAPEGKRFVEVDASVGLTSLAWAATALLMTLAEWANERLAEVEQARLRYRQTAARDPIGRAGLDGLQAA